VSEFLKRTLFTVVAVPFAIACIYYGDWALAALLAILSALGAWEFYRIARGAGSEPLDNIGIPVAGLIPLLVHADRRGVFTVPIAAFAVVTLIVFAAAIWVRGLARKPLNSVATTVFGVIYTGGMLSFAYALRYHDYAVGNRAGAALLLLPFVLTWTSDTGGYLVGRAIGKRKLIPSISPGKSVEGALGALTLCVIVAWVYVHYVLRPQAQLALAPVATLIFGALISIAVQTGDLAESMMKREAGVKDSSRILPGHGGILDRFDGLIFALPVAYLMLDLWLLPAPR
jgi:phosphatidate cytidylyltransferase